MNDKQRSILKFLASAITISMLFPPFEARLPNGVADNVGYGFIFMPPDSGYSIQATVSAFQLLVQILGFSVLGLVAYILADSAHKPADQLEPVDEKKARVKVSNSASILEALRRSKFWFAAGVSFVLMPFFTASDNNQLALKLLSNTALTIVVLIIVIIYHFIRIKRGIGPEVNRPLFNIKRLGIIVAVGVISIFLSVLWINGSDQRRVESLESENSNPFSDLVPKSDSTNQSQSQAVDEGTPWNRNWDEEAADSN